MVGCLSRFSWRSVASGLLLALLTSGAVSASGEAAAGEAECAALLAKRVQAYYDGVRDLRADFVQRSRSVALGSGGGSLSESTGEVEFAKPGRMRWEYREPEPSTVVSDGETLWIYDPEAAELQVMRVGAGTLGGAGLQFLFGEGDLLASFEARSGGCEGVSSDLELLPREDAAYERIVLRVDTQTGAVQETRVDDLFGNRTELRFSGSEINRDPEPSRFRFEAPPGTRVLEVPASE